MTELNNSYISIGSNLGDRLFFLQSAVDLISERLGIVLAVSDVYETESWGFSGEPFLNIVIHLKTRHTAAYLLTEFLEIEKKLGRTHSLSNEYKSRVIDIDILLYENEIIFSQNIVVPHPLMNKRKFVLLPLKELVPNFIHPIEKKTINELYNLCEDLSEINKISERINKPISLTEKFNYLVIEGNIGAGKTSLTNMLSDDFNAKKVLERFADNPFLPQFYKDQERYAFPLEMSFLADRYHQLSDDMSQFDLFKNCIISDYYFIKSLIFARVTLPNDEYALYRKVFEIMYNDMTKPDLYIYLYQNTKRLMENIKKRGRDYEQNIEEGYLQKIQDGYLNYIQTDKNLNVLFIDVSDMDFVNNKEDYRKIIREILNYKN